MKNSKIDVFLKMIPDQPGTIFTPKKHNFNTKTNDFEIENEWCEALSLIFTSGPAFGWFWGSPRYCVILTIWPHTFDRNTWQIDKSLEVTWELC